MVRVLAFGILSLVAVSLFFRDYSPHFSVENLPHDYHVLWKVKTRVAQGVDPYFASWNESKYNYSPGLIPFLQILPNNPQVAFYLVRGLAILLWVLGIFFGVVWRSKRDLLCLCGGLILAWQGAGVTLAMGQAELLGLGLMLLAFRLFDTKPMATAWILAFLPIVKLPWLFLWIPFGYRLWVTQPRWALSFRIHLILASFLGWLAIPLLTAGTELTLQWYLSWLEVLKHQNPELFTLPANQSIWSRLAPLKSIVPGGTLLIPLACLGILGFLALQGLRQIKSARHFSSKALALTTPWVLLMQLANPLAWYWAGAYLPGAFFSIFENDLGKRSKKIFAAMLVVLALTFLFQQKWVNGWVLGIPDRSAAHAYGVMTVHWLSILGLSLL